MSKKNVLAVGGLVLTRDGNYRVIMDTVEDGLIASTSEGKSIRIDKISDDLTGGKYGESKDIMKVFSCLVSVAGRIFEPTGRDILFDRDATVAASSCDATSTPKELLKVGMLVVTADGKQRLALPTADKGLVLATPDSKFICVDKLDDNLQIVGYKKTDKNVVKMYSVASGLTTDFFSTEGRDLVLDTTVSQKRKMTISEIENEFGVEVI